MPNKKSEKNHPKNRNFFPVLAVLAAAGATLGICALVLNLSDIVGGAPTPIAAVPDTAEVSDLEQTLSTEGSTLSASVTSPATLPISTILGTHSAPVVAIAVPLNISQGASLNALESEVSSRTQVITGSYDSTVRIWATDGSETNLLKELVHNSYVNALALIPSQFSNRLNANETAARVATGSGSGEIKLWDTLSGELITTIADNSGRILSLSANVDGRLMASGGSRGTLKVWPVDAIAAQKSQTNLRGQILQASGPALTALTFHPTDPDLLISGDQAGTLQLWDVALNQVKLTVAANPSANDDFLDNDSFDDGNSLSNANSEQDSRAIVSLTISPDGRYVASASNNNLIRIWDIEASRLVKTLSGHSSAITAVAFSPNGRVLASGSVDQTVKTWNWAEGLVHCTLSDRAGPIRAIAFTDDADTLISGSDQGTIRAWDLSRDSNRTCLGK